MDDNDEKSHLDIKKQNDVENKNLWQKLQIDFRLEAFKFPDNKIYGTININPESSRKLIKKLVLVVNKNNRIEFDPHYTHLSASGFNINRKNPSAYIEAIPLNTEEIKEKKTSKICYFFFTGEIFALGPTLSFDFSNGKIKLVIKWYHIGDKHAHKYILYLDNKEIQYIRQKLIEDAFDVRIEGFKPGEKHTFQLTARLNNEKETYRSDLMEFIVPDQQLNDDDSTEFITVLNEPIPHNLPAYMPTEKDKIQEDFNPKEQKVEEKKDLRQTSTHTLQPIKKPKHPSNINVCCNNIPHKTFPGIEHYFQNTLINKSLSSEEIITTTDDDAVVIQNN